MWNKLQSDPVEGGISKANTRILHKETKGRRIGASASNVSPAWSVHGDGEFIQMERFSSGYREFSPLVAFWRGLTWHLILQQLFGHSTQGPQDNITLRLPWLWDSWRITAGIPGFQELSSPSIGIGGCVTCNAALYFGEFILQNIGMHLPRSCPAFPHWVSSKVFYSLHTRKMHTEFDCCKWTELFSCQQSTHLLTQWGHNDPDHRLNR